jgi:acetyl-CoA synthetase
MSIDTYLTPEQVANKLSIQVRTVHGWLRAGQIRGVKLNRLWRIREEDLDELLKSGQIAS